MTKDTKPDAWMPDLSRVKAGSSLRVEIHLSNFCALTAALSCAEVGLLTRMLFAEAALQPVPEPASPSIARAWERRDEFSRVKGGFGRVSLSLAKRQAVFDRDGGVCRYCATALDWSTYHCDHVEPVSKGGSDDLENLAAACADYNLSKKDRTLAQWRGH